jgi:hypothetical protein
MEEQTQHNEIKTAGEVQTKKQTWRANLQRNFRSFLFIVFLILAFCIYWFYFNG